MSAMKRLIEDTALLMHEGRRDELEALLEGWDDCQKVALLMHAVALHNLVSGNPEEGKQA
jgi:hypothetical protein